MKKCMSLFLCLTMLIGLYVPVRADDFEGENWIELPIHVKAEDGTAVRMGEASLALMEETNGEWDEVQWCWVESSETAADTWIAHINTAELQSDRPYYAVLYAFVDTNVLSDGYLYCGENAEEAVAFYYSDENGSGQQVRIGSTAALTFVVETGWVITGTVNAPNGYIERRSGEGFPYPNVAATTEVTEDGDGKSYYWGYVAINSRTAPWTYSIVVPKTVANYTIQRENNYWINYNDDYETNILFGGNAEYGSIPVTGNTTGPDITLGLLGATVSGTITAPTGADWWDLYDLEAQMSNGESYWGWFDQSGESAVQYEIALPASPDGVTYTLYVEYSDSGFYRSGWLIGTAGSYTLTEDDSAATRFSVANAAISFALPELERTEYSGRLLMEDGNAALPAGTQITVDLFCYQNVVTGDNGGTSTGGATPSPAPASGGGAAPSPAPVSGGGGGSSASSSAAASSGGAAGSPATTVSVGDFETETISVSAEVPSVQYVTATSSSLTVYSRDAVVGEDGRWSASFVNQSNGPKKLRITVPAVPNSGVRPGDYWYTGSMTASEDEGEAAWLPADTGGLDVYCEAGIGLTGTIAAPKSAADRRWGANLWAEMDSGEGYYAGTSRETRSLTYNIGLPLSESDGTYRLYMNYWYYDGDDERVDSVGYLKLNNGDAQLVRNADDATVFSAADNAPSFQLPDIRKVEVTVRLVSQDASDTVEMPNGRLSLIKLYDKGYAYLADGALRPNGDGTWSATIASNYISLDDTYCLRVFPGDDSNVMQDDYYYCGEDATAPETNSDYGINTRIDDGVVNKIVVETGWVITGSVYLPESGYLNLNYPDENYYPGLSVYAETVDGDSRSYHAYAERASGEEGWSYRFTVPKETSTYQVRTDANSGWWINRNYKTNVAFGASARSEEFTVSGSGQAPDVTLPLVGPTVTGTITYPLNTSSLHYPYLYAVIGDEQYEVMVENGSDWLTKQYSITFPLSEEEGKYRLFVSGTFVAGGTRNNLDGWLKETDGDYTLVKDENKATWFNVADGAPSFEMPKEQKTKLYLSLVSTDGSEVSIPSGSIGVYSENIDWSSDLERDSDGKWYVQIPSAEISEEEQYRICFWTGDKSNVVQNEYYYAGPDAEAAVTNSSDAALTTLTDGATYKIPVETGWVFTGRVVVPEGGYIHFSNAYGQYPAPCVMVDTVDTTSDHYWGEVEVDSESGPWEYRLVLPKKEATYRLSMNDQYADNFDTNIYFATQEDVLFTAGATASVPDITLDLIGATVTGTISANFSARDFNVYNVCAETTEGHTYGAYCDVTGESLTYQIVLPASEVGKSYRLRIHCGYSDEITQNWHYMNGWLEKAGGKDYVTAQGGTVFTVQDSMIDAKIEKLVSTDSDWDDVFSAVRSGTEIEKIFYNLRDSAVAVAVAYDEQGRMLESRSTLLTSADGNAAARFRFTNAVAAAKLSFYLVREGSWIPTDERQTMQY